MAFDGIFHLLIDSKFNHSYKINVCDVAVIQPVKPLFFSIHVWCFKAHLFPMFLHSLRTHLSFYLIHAIFIHWLHTIPRFNHQFSLLQTTIGLTGYTGWALHLAAEHAHGAALRGAHGQGQQPLRRQGGQGAAALNANAGTLDVEAQKKNRAQQNLLGFLGDWCFLFFVFWSVGYNWDLWMVSWTYNMFETHNQDWYMIITYYNILSIEGKANDFLN